MKVVLTLCLAFALAACGTTASEVAQSPKQRVFALKSDYSALLTAAVAYESQPRCLPEQSRFNPCSDPKAVAEMRRADVAAFAAIDSAEKAVYAPGATDNSTNLALSGAISAVGALRTILITYGVTK